MTGRPSVLRQVAPLVLVHALFAPVTHAQTRGESLYANHCSVCHAQQIHWRARSVVKDWRGLRAEVRKWQGVASLGWSEEEITEVARFLNQSAYGFPVPVETASRQAYLQRMAWNLPLAGIGR